MVKALADSVSGESPLPGSLMAVFLLTSHMVERAGDLSEASFIRPLTPFLRLHPHDLKTSQTSLPNTIALGVKLLTYRNLGGGHKHSVCSC